MVWLIARVYTTWQVVENCVLQISTKVSLSELDHDCTREGNTVLRKRSLWLPASPCGVPALYRWIQTFIRILYTVGWPYTPFWSHPNYGPSSRVPRDGKLTVMKNHGCIPQIDQGFCASALSSLLTQVAVDGKKCIRKPYMHVILWILPLAWCLP